MDILISNSCSGYIDRTVQLEISRSNDFLVFPNVLSVLTILPVVGLYSESLLSVNQLLID